MIAMRFFLAVAVTSSIAVLLVTPPSREIRMEETLHQRIDRWIAQHGLNLYGDPPDTMYTGGSPLFDERTGIFKNRYEYILERHPELRDDGPRTR
jgi:hypothetical protein